MRRRVLAASVLVVGLAGVASALLIGPALSSAEVPPQPPAIGVAQAQQIGLTRAARAGDAHPTVAVVEETLAEASTSIGGPPGAAFANSETPVYLVRMRGHFTLASARVPRGFKAPTGNALQTIVDRSGFVLGLHLGNE